MRNKICSAYQLAVSWLVDEASLTVVILGRVLNDSPWDDIAVLIPSFRREHAGMMALNADNDGDLRRFLLESHANC